MCGWISKKNTCTCEAAYWIGDITVEEGENKRMLAMQVTWQRGPHEKHQSKECYHPWVHSERKRLGIDDAVGEWNKKPILYHLKRVMTLFVSWRSCHWKEKIIVLEHLLGPLRRTFVPRYASLTRKKKWPSAWNKSCIKERKEYQMVNRNETKNMLRRKSNH